MARLLIVGGGCRGERLAVEAVREGHAARIVTRGERRCVGIEAAGTECFVGDPNRLGTLRGALEGVTIACWLLATASGPQEQLHELHTARLRAFLESAIDTTVRGVLYEVAGGGERIAREVAERNAMPLALVRADPADARAWLAQAREALSSLLIS